MTQSTVLRWTIRGSFLDYLHALPDVAITIDGVTLDAEGFAFPSSGDALGFAGRAHITAHGGALDVTFADPVIDYSSGAALLTADTGDGREPVARLLDAPVSDEFAGGGVAQDVALTIEGSVWLGAVYAPWARMDPVRVESV